MVARSEVLGDESIRRKKALGVPGGLEALNASFALMTRPMRVFIPVLERAMLAMFHYRHHLTFGGGVALQLIRDNHPGYVWQISDQLFEACLDRPFVATAL
jgi:hypothetical protein